MNAALEEPEPRRPPVAADGVGATQCGCSSGRNRIGGQRAAFAGSLAELASPGVQILSEYNLRPQSGHNLDVVETEGGG